MADGGQIECVLLRDEVRRTICISTQVGCGMGCVFCASGLDGLERNLTTGEIVEQMLRLQRLLGPDERLSHIVVMGMGEPLANLDDLLPALEEASRDGRPGHQRPANHDLDGGTSQSRCADWPTPGPATGWPCRSTPRTTQIRRQIVPVGETISLAEILAEADHYFDLSGRQLTFEYVCWPASTTAPSTPASWRDLLGRRTALVNVIPYNPVAGLPYRTPIDGRPTSVPPHPRRARPGRPLSPSQGRRHRRRLRATPPPLVIDYTPTPIFSVERRRLSAAAVPIDRRIWTLQRPS